MNIESITELTGFHIHITRTEAKELAKWLETTEYIISSTPRWILDIYKELAIYEHG